MSRQKGLAAKTPPKSELTDSLARQESEFPASDEGIAAVSGHKGSAAGKDHLSEADSRCGGDMCDAGQAPPFDTVRVSQAKGALASAEQKQVKFCASIDDEQGGGEDPQNKKNALRLHREDRRLSSAFAELENLRRQAKEEARTKFGKPLSDWNQWYDHIARQNACTKNSLATSDPHLPRGG